MNTNIKITLKIIFIAVLLFIATVLIINTSPFDEKLLPEVQEILKDKPYPPVVGNSYFALMGITAADNKDMLQVGNQLIQRYIENRTKGDDRLKDSDYLQIQGNTHEIDAVWIQKYPSCDANRIHDCLTRDYSGLYDSPINDSRLITQLNRYQQIIAMHTYQNFQDYSLASPLPNFVTLIKLSQIYLLDTYKNQSPNEFLQALSKDRAFWLLMLNNSNFLIDKMVATAQVRKSANLLSEFIRNNPLPQDSQMLFDSILSPLNSKELDLSKTFITESRATLKLYQNLESMGSWSNRLLYQPNATCNYHYKKSLVERLRQAHLSLQQLITLRKQPKETIGNSSGLKLDYIYNMVGKVLEEYSGCNCDDYIVRGYDVNNIIKLVKIQLQIKQNNLTDLSSILTQKANLNPYNAQPFNYDKKQQILSFECLDKYAKCEVML